MADLPDYSWCSTDPQNLGIPPAPWGLDLAPIPVATGEEAELPDGPAGEESDLLRVTGRRIRVLCSYWHAGWPFAVPEAWARPEVLRRLRFAAELLPEGFGLAVWDAWRDPRLQAALYEAVYTDSDLPPGFVNYPDPDPRRCPPHATGGTLDLTLTWQLRPLALGTGFDAFVPEAAAAALEDGGPPLARDLRRLLAHVMGAAGFVPHPQEWWHWEFGTRWWSASTGAPVRFGPARPGG